MNRIKEYRLKNGAKQSDLARLANVRQTTISNWENEITEIDRQSLIVLKNYFNVSTDYLLGITDDPTSPSKKEDIPFVTPGKAAISINLYDGVKKTVQVPIEKLKAIEAMLEAPED